MRVYDAIRMIACFCVGMLEFSAVVYVLYLVLGAKS